MTPRLQRLALRAGGLCLIVLAVARTTSAHPAPFSYIDVRLGEGPMHGRVVVHDLDLAHDLGLPGTEPLATDAGVQARAAAIGELLAARFALSFDGQPARWTITGLRALPEQSLVEVSWQGRDGVPGRLDLRAAIFPYDPAHQTFLNVYEGSALVRQEILNSERTGIALYTGTRQGRWSVFTSFVGSGLQRIAVGPQHILFVAGLLLLGGRPRQLLAIVVAFTLGYSLTLALATSHILNPPARLIEPAIALSLVYVGADNLLVGQRGRDVRVWVALFFGMVHGFGFASSLREIGLPPRAIGLSLSSFNIGIELGLAAAIGPIAAALSTVRRGHAAVASRLAVAASVLLFLAGSYWFVRSI